MSPYAAGRVSGVVVTTDHFGNLITNIDADAIAHLAAPRVVAGGHEFELRVHLSRTIGAYPYGCRLGATECVERVHLVGIEARLAAAPPAVPGAFQPLSVAEKTDKLRDSRIRTSPARRNHRGRNGRSET